MAAVDSAPTFTQPKVVEKAFLLPIVSDSYSYGLTTMSSLAASLHLSSQTCPYLSSSLASLPPLLSSHLSSLQAISEQRLPEVVTSMLNLAREQVIDGGNYMDSTLCVCLDQLLVKVPALTSPTPALLTKTSTDLASFTIAKLALKGADFSLGIADSFLKLAPASYSSRCEPIVSGLKTVRGQVHQVRMEGARIDGAEEVANVEADVLSVDDVLDILDNRDNLENVDNIAIIVPGRLQIIVNEGVLPRKSTNPLAIAIEKQLNLQRREEAERMEEAMGMEVAAGMEEATFEASETYGQGAHHGSATQKDGKKGKKNYKN